MKKLKEIEKISKEDLIASSFIMQSELETIREIIKTVRQQAIDLSIELETLPASFCEWAILNRYYGLTDGKLIWYKPKEKTNGLTTQELYQEYLTIIKTNE
jgi:hypothetical protein